jgi:Uma2 family endonuclease
MEPKPYEEDDQPSDMVCEPPATYGTSAIFLDPAKRYTYADYLTWADDIRRELVDGIIKLMSAPIIIHSAITSGLVGRMWPFIKKRKGKCKIFHSPVDVRLPKNGETADNKIYTVVQPDIVVVCDPSKIDEKGIIGAPDLVVEVQSPSTAKYVMSQKFDLYEEAGVKEYWVIYPKAGLTVFLLQDNGKYDNGTTYDIIYMPDAKIPVHTIEGLEIALKELIDDE